MKTAISISDLIGYLLSIKAKHGDLEVYKPINTPIYSFEEIININEECECIEIGD